VSGPENPQVKLVTPVDLRQAAAKFLLAQFEKTPGTDPYPPGELIAAALHLTNQL
jgi:hypothetical protein